MEVINIMEILATRNLTGVKYFADNYIHPRNYRLEVHNILFSQDNMYKLSFLDDIKEISLKTIANNLKSINLQAYNIHIGTVTFSSNAWNALPSIGTCDKLLYIKAREPHNFKLAKLKKNWSMVCKRGKYKYQSDFCKRSNNI